MDIKRDYYEVIELFKSGSVLAWTIAFLILLFILHLYLPSYNIYLINIILVNVILALGFNILVGCTGQTLLLLFHIRILQKVCCSFKTIASGWCLQRLLNRHAFRMVCGN